MNLTDHFDHQEKKQKKEHFKHLIEVAFVDKTIDISEKEMLHQIGKRLGFTDPEIDNLIKCVKKSAFDPPYELSKRFEQFYDIIKMVMADGRIDNDEMRLATGLAIKYGFNDNEIPNLLVLLIKGIKNGEDEEDLFEKFRKGRKVS